MASSRLTIRSSRTCFAARLVVLACSTPPCRYAGRLNSGVRLLGNTNVGFKQRVLLQSWFVSSWHVSCSRRRPETQKSRRCGSKRLSVGQKHWFLAAARANVWVRVAPNCFANHVITPEARRLGYNGKRLQPNKSFKLMSLRGADFCGNVYHNAAPLRATA